MNLFAHFRQIVIDALAALAEEGAVPRGLDVSRVAVEPPRDPAHGDIATNAAMMLGKAAGMAPRALAELLLPHLRRNADVVGAEVAGPGFINLRLAGGFWHARLADVLRVGPAYGDSTMGGKRPVNVEYVSVNPTGPLHAGHGRVAVVGDALAALLEKAGFAVCREYYINDAGAQVDTLARSLHIRYREALGETVGEIPAGLYPGDYLKPTGAALAARDGARWQSVPESEWLEPLRRFAVDEMMALIRSDLDALGVHQDVFTSERALVEAGAVDRAYATLEAAGLIYVGTLEPPKGKQLDDWEPRPLPLFRASQFGDDVDRPVKKSDGSWTYFGADLAYHFDKFRRGFGTLIDVWGADHAGAVKRLKAAVAALTGGAAVIDIKLCQLVNLLENGQPVRMSKRAGTFITLRDVVDEVGRDAVRFSMLTRRNDQALDFDFAVVREQSKDNPVFYVKYAHARAHSAFRRAREQLPGHAFDDAAVLAAPLARLVSRDEIALIRQLAQWPRIVEGAAEAHEPHRIAFFLQELAAEFHGLWHKGNDDESLRFVVAADPALTLARLALVQGVAHVVASGLRMLGVEAPEEMR